MDADLHNSASTVFQTSAQSHEPGPTFARDFASRKLEQDLTVLDMPQRNLVPAWEKCVRNAMTAKVVVEDGASFAVLLDLLIPFLTHNRGWKCRVPQRQCSLLVDLARIARGISDKLGELLSELRIVILSGTEVLVGRRGLEEDGLGGRRTFINLSRRLADHPTVET